jgi:hypothetical protein
MVNPDFDRMDDHIMEELEILGKFYCIILQNRIRKGRKQPEDFNFFHRNASVQQIPGFNDAENDTNKQPFHPVHNHPGNKSTR